jgi:hypothetical protein
MDRTALAHQVSLTLGDHTGDYDIDAVVEDLVQEHGPIENIDAVPNDVYWETVRKHDRAA